MQLKQKITIDFEEFLTTGKFDFLQLGKTKEWVLNNFPDPDDFEQLKETYQNDVWCYGNIELHFLNDRLFMIFSDYIDDLDGGNALTLEKWFLGNPEKSKLLDVIHELNKKGIDYRKYTNKVGDTTVNLELSSGVKLSFILEEKEDEGYLDYIERCKTADQNEFKLGAFCFTS